MNTIRGNDKVLKNSLFQYRIAFEKHIRRMQLGHISDIRGQKVMNELRYSIRKLISKTQRLSLSSTSAM